MPGRVLGKFVLGRARNYKIRLKDGTKLTRNAGEFNLGPLQRVLEAKDAQYHGKNK